MNFETGPVSGLCIRPGTGPRSRRAVADLVRRMVHARRGVSRIAVVDWVLQFIDGSDRTNAETLVRSVIDDLCELKDIGHGTIRGEPTLVALPERRVVLPDGRIIAFGDHGIARGSGIEALFPEVEGRATETLIDFLDTFHQPVTLAGVEALTSKGRWTDEGPMDPALRRVLMLCGVFDSDLGEWSVSEPNMVFVNEWFGLVDPGSLSDVSEEVDESQLRVARASAVSRIVVEAGPGTGKTHAACERVIALVQDQGLAPSRILLLSFTRVAVAELRDRIGRRLQDVPNVAALQIRTFDSFAASLLASSGDTASGGYDANVRAATRLLRSDNLLIADAVGQLEHVMIDEAQDLVGDRKDLCEALVKLLDPSCGITVFGDSAQSIYGYQNRSKSDGTFLDTISTADKFTSEKLEHDHRTRTDILREMFRSAREVLRANPSGSREGYFHVRQLIKDAAVENEITNFAVHPSTTRGLILTRSRRSLFTAAEALRDNGRQFRLRLPDRPLRIHPWIGAALGGRPASERLSRDSFGILYDTLYPAEERDVDECWHILLELDGSGRDTISTGRVADGLIDPPLELLSDHEGSVGPLLSTIHAVKGREDQRVLLMLTQAPHGDDVDWAEEARTLYVGATRASSELRTGWISPKKFYPIGKPERFWAARADHRMIEIGLEGDLVDWTEFRRSGQVAAEADTIARVWRASIEQPKAEARPDVEGRLIVRVAEPEGSAIACLSENFSSAVQAIRKVEPGAALPEIISGISVVGGTTVVVPGRSGEAPALALMPLFGGFARVPR